MVFIVVIIIVRCCRRRHRYIHFTFHNFRPHHITPFKFLADSVFSLCFCLYKYLCFYSQLLFYCWHCCRCWCWCCCCRWVLRPLVLVTDSVKKFRNGRALFIFSLLTLPRSSFSFRLLFNPLRVIWRSITNWKKCENTYWFALFCRLAISHLLPSRDIDRRAITCLSLVRLSSRG